MRSFQKGNKKVLNAWAFYDWANSVYSLTIVSAVFPLLIGAYLKSLSIEKLNACGGEISHTSVMT